MVSAPFTLALRDRWLIASFAEPWAILSWAIVNGGWQRTREVAWLYLELNEIADIQDPTAWMRSQMHAAGLAGAVGMMTSRKRHAYVTAEAFDGGCAAWAAGTMGFSNALRVGDGSTQPAIGGTINLLVCVSRPLTTEAALETMSLLTEAKALTTIESGLLSRQSGLPASGTGTDYMALAWPLTGNREIYGGKHTAVGAAAGQAAIEVMRLGIHSWREEQNV